MRENMDFNQVNEHTMKIIDGLMHSPGIFTFFTILILHIFVEFVTSVIRCRAMPIQVSHVNLENLCFIHIKKTPP